MMSRRERERERGREREREREREKEREKERERQREEREPVFSFVPTSPNFPFRSSKSIPFYADPKPASSAL